MKKTLIVSLMFGMLTVTFAGTDVRAAANSFGSPSEHSSAVQPRRYRRTRSYIRTRTVRIGYRVYRETYRITYYRNGRRSIKVLRRVRIR